MNVVDLLHGFANLAADNPLLLLFTLVAILLAVYGPRLLRRGDKRSAVEDFALEM